MKTMCKVPLVSLVAAIALPYLAYAQAVLVPSSSLSSDDPDGTFSAFGDAYGAASDSWREWLFVGSPRETTFRDGFDAQDGAVYIYEKNRSGSYELLQKLTMPGNSVLFGDRFGGGIAAAGGWLFVGAANDQDFPGLVDPREGADGFGEPPFVFAGQVHVYKLKRGAWDYFDTLTAPVPKSGGTFGTRSQASHITLNSQGTVAVIGELNNYDGGVGQLHVYGLKRGKWQHTQSIDAPLPGIDTFGDNLVFASDDYLVAGAGDISDDELTDQGYIFVYQAKKKGSGKFDAEPKQTIAGPVIVFADCGAFGSSFGHNGLDAAGGVVAVANPCATGAAGDFAGAVSVYRLGDDAAAPLTLDETIEGDVPDLFLGGNAFASRHSVAVSESGECILAGSPLSPVGIFNPAAAGADVRVYVSGVAGWMNASNLTTASPAAAIFRSFGDTVFFTNEDESAFVREGNFIDPVVSGLKGQGLFFDLMSLCQNGD
jgi:hypothetical protein